ncbi:MAG TPA: hypothetical protein VGE68_02815 [Sphingomicrobium sp.]
MIHFLPLEPAAPVADPTIDGGELATRIAGLKRALRLLEPHGHGPSCDEDEFTIVEFDTEAARRCFDQRSERVIGSAAAGLDAVIAVRNDGFEANSAAIDLVADTIREGLANLSELLKR